MNKKYPATDKLDPSRTTKGQQRKSYISPELQRFGKIKEVTLGGSLGLGDSGAPTVQKVPIGP
jgi:hypothetical protein